MRINPFLIGGGAALCCGGLVLSLPGVAEAAFPGGNGDIAFISTRSGGGTPLVFTVNPEASDPSSTVSEVTNDASGDSEPFYAPDGTIVFASDAPTDAGSDNSNWKIFSINPAATSCAGTSNWSDCRVLISQSTADTTDDDYAPSVSPDGTTVLFERIAATGTASLFTVPIGGGAATLLYTPPASIGLQQPAADSGAVSRPIYDPADPSEVVFVGANNHIEMITGVGTPAFNPSQTPVDLSADAGLVGTQQDDDPDFSPDGGTLIFDSTRSGGRQIYTLNVAQAQSSGQAATPLFANNTGNTDTEPVFSPDGTQVAFVRPVVQQSDDVITYMDTDVNGSDQATGSLTDLTKVNQGSGAPLDSQPDWAPVQVSVQTPEAPLAIGLPVAGGAVLVGAGLLMGRRQRRQVPA